MNKIIKNSVAILLSILIINCNSKNTELFNEDSIQLVENETLIDDIIKLESFKLYKFKFPIDDKYKKTISSEQGIRQTIDPLKQYWHQGIDIACPDGTAVFADKDGKILDVYPSYHNGKKWKGHPVYGGLIIIYHELDNTYSLYAHLSFTNVNIGDYVKMGQQIGLSGGVRGRRASGQSTGPHLHYSVYLDIQNVIF